MKSIRSVLFIYTFILSFSCVKGTVLKKNIQYAYDPSKSICIRSRDSKTTWACNSMIRTIKDRLIFHDDSPYRKSLMTNLKMLNYNSTTVLNLLIKFDEIVKNRGKRQTEKSTNVFIIQNSSSHNIEVNQKNKNDNNSEIELNGLVIFFIGYTVNSYRQEYFFTYRYFPKKISVRRDYFDYLAEKKGNREDNYCDFYNIKELVDIQMRIDYDDTDTLYFGFRESKSNSKTDCFFIKNISRFIPKARNYIQFQQTTDRVITLKTHIFKIELLEQHSELELADNMEVSKNLVGEMFDKTETFGNMLEDNGKLFNAVYKAQKNLEEKATLLSIYAKDLNKGSREFQEYMVEFLKRPKHIKEKDLPKLNEINIKINDLKIAQQEMHERFEKVIEIKKSNDIVKSMYKNVDSILDNLEQALAGISSDEFNDFKKRTEKLIWQIENQNLDTILLETKAMALEKYKKLGEINKKAKWIIIGLIVFVILSTMIIHYRLKIPDNPKSK